MKGVYDTNIIWFFGFDEIGSSAFFCLTRGKENN